MKNIICNIETITKNDLCLSCGACFHICPFSNIEMKYNDYRGKWDADVLDNEKCKNCSGQKNCLAVCPSYSVDYISLANSNENKLLGRIKNVYNGYSKNETRRINSSSGGFISELCETVLKKKLVDAIISISHDDGLDYTPKLIYDINEMPNSIYHNVNFENAVDLLKNNEGKYLLIGLPCQITSIKLLIKHKRFSFLNERIYLCVALICGYTSERTNLLAFSYYNNFRLGEVTYRENGRYRKTRLLNDKESVVFDVANPKRINEQINNMIMFDRLITQNSCLYCVDHIGYCADLVVGDAWQKRYKNDVVGTNIIISRTQRAEEILSKIDAYCFENGNNDEITESQTEIYAYGSLGEAMIKERKKKNIFHPKPIRTTHNDDIRYHRISKMSKIKIFVLKKILRKENYVTLKFLYVILNFVEIMKIIYIRQKRKL